MVPFHNRVSGRQTSKLTAAIQQKKKDYPLVIRGPLKDLGDVLKLARVNGRIALKTRKVKVKPFVYPYGNDYLVIVEPDGSGCSELSAVGERAKEKR